MIAATQSTRLPFYCSRCSSLYDTPEKLIACLARHEESEALMDQIQRTRNPERSS